jgi:hypothetical protein
VAAVTAGRSDEQHHALLPLSHVFLHVAFCNAIARAAPSAQIAMHVAVYDRIKRPQLDKTFQFQRGDANQQIVDFEMLPGVYRVELSVPRYGCNREDYLALLPGLSRQVDEQLADGPPPPNYPMLLEGTVPQAFLYANPTFVVFDKTAQCNKPVGDPLQAHMTVENDQDAYYIWLYPDRSLAAQAPLTLALQLGTSTGENHYIRVRIPLYGWGGWPATVQFNVSEDTLDGLAGSPVDTLLCPKLYETEVG